MTTVDMLNWVLPLLGISAQELDSLSDVEPGTSEAVIAGAVSPNVDLGEILLGSLGYGPVGPGEPAMLDAAVSAFTDGVYRNVWTERWERAGFVDQLGLAVDVGRLAPVAGIPNKVARRPGRLRCHHDRPWQETAALLDAASIGYAVSGLPALSHEDGMREPVFYISGPVRAVLDAGLRELPSAGVATSFLPWPDSLDTEIAGGVTYVSPPRALLDAFGGMDRAPDYPEAFVSLVAAGRA